MKKITLSIDEDVLAAARRYAAEQDSTVNAMVREYLANLAPHQDPGRRARERILQLSQKSEGRLGKKTWDRQELHER